jgi:hypothetical protein
MSPKRNACKDRLSAAYQVRHRPSLRGLLTERLNTNVASHTLMAEFTQINNFPHHTIQCSGVFTARRIQPVALLNGIYSV